MFNVNNTYIRISGCIINVLLKQEGERIKYWTFKINIPSSSNGRQINWMLTLRKVGIPSFEFEGSGMGSAYTDTKIQKIDSEFFGSNYLKFLYSAGSLYSQLGVCTPCNTSNLSLNIIFV